MTDHDLPGINSFNSATFVNPWISFILDTFKTSAEYVMLSGMLTVDNDAQIFFCGWSLISLISVQNLGISLTFLLADDGSSTNVS